MNLSEVTNIEPNPLTVPPAGEFVNPSNVASVAESVNVSEFTYIEVNLSTAPPAGESVNLSNVASVAESGNLSEVTYIGESKSIKRRARGWICHIPSVNCQIGSNGSNGERWQLRE